MAAHRPFAVNSRMWIARFARAEPVSLFSLLALLRRAIGAQQRRDLEKEAVRLLHQAGGRLTDSVEREIARRHLGV